MLLSIAGPPSAYSQPSRSGVGSLAAGEALHLQEGDGELIREQSRGPWGGGGGNMDGCGQVHDDERRTHAIMLT